MHNNILSCKFLILYFYNVYRSSNASDLDKFWINDVMDDSFDEFVFQIIKNKMLYGGNSSHNFVIEAGAEVSQKQQDMRDKYEKSSSTIKFLELSKSVANLVSSYVHDIISIGVNKAHSKSHKELKTMEISQDEDSVNKILSKNSSVVSLEANKFITENKEFLAEKINSYFNAFRSSMEESLDKPLTTEVAQTEHEQKEVNTFDDINRDSFIIEEKYKRLNEETKDLIIEHIAGYYYSAD